jgi:hypothetical protein
MKIRTRKPWKVCFGTICMFNSDRYPSSRSSIHFVHSFRVVRYGYQLSGKGRWTSLALKAPKSKGGGKAKKKKQREKNWSDNEGSGDDAGLVAEDNEVVCTLLTSFFW